MTVDAAAHHAFVQAAWSAGFQSDPAVIPDATDILDAVHGLLVAALPADVDITDVFRTDYDYGRTVVGLQTTGAVQAAGVEIFQVTVMVTSPTRAGGWGTANLIRRVVHAGVGSGLFLRVEDTQLPVFSAGVELPSSVYQHDLSLSVSVQQGELL